MVNWVGTNKLVIFSALQWAYSFSQKKKQQQKKQQKQNKTKQNKKQSKTKQKQNTHKGTLYADAK